MSRIYEALQRAGLERKIAPDSEAVEIGTPVAVAGVEESALAKADVTLESIVQHPWSPSMPSFPTLADRGAGVEQFRRLRSRIYQLRYEAPLKTILVSSGTPGEGKSFVAANLAMSLARNSINNILLIDGDLRRPTIHNLLGAPSSPGLSEYLAGTAAVGDIMQRDRGSHNGQANSERATSNLTLIPAGRCGDNSSELAANHRFEELIATLSPHFDWILIDSPPVLAVTDAVDLARAADGVMLVVREARTPFDVAQRASAAFSNSRVLGFVLNAAKDAPRSGSYYYYYHYYGGQEPSDGAKGRKDKQGQG
jgi:capsular exopolysaccharide synthesis family protein